MIAGLAVLCVCLVLVDYDPWASIGLWLGYCLGLLLENRYQRRANA